MPHSLSAIVRPQTRLLAAALQLAGLSKNPTAFCALASAATTAAPHNPANEDSILAPANMGSLLSFPPSSSMPSRLLATSKDTRHAFVTLSTPASSPFFSSCASFTPTPSWPTASSSTLFLRHLTHAQRHGDSQAASTLSPAATAAPKPSSTTKATADASSSDREQLEAAKGPVAGKAAAAPKEAKDKEVRDSAAARAGAPKEAKEPAAGKVAAPKEKELHLKPRIAEHDLATKLRKAEGWLAEGHRVQLVVEFKREEQQQAAAALADSVVGRLAGKGQPSSPKRLMKGTWVLLLRPVPPPKQPKEQGQQQKEKKEHTGGKVAAAASAA